MTLAMMAQTAAAQETVDWPAQLEAKLAELRAQGEPVTFDEFMAGQPTVPDEENSALVFLQAFQAMGSVASQLPRGSQFDRGFSDEVGMRNADAALQLVRASVQADAEALRLIHQGAALPGGTYPIVLTPNPFDIELSHLSRLRNAARLCIRETAVHAHDGDGAAAADSLIAVRRLAASLGDRTFLIGVLVRIAIDSLFCYDVENTLGLCEIPVWKLDALAREVSLEADGVSIADAMRAERGAACQLLTTDDENVQRTMQSTGLALGAVTAASKAKAALDYLEIAEDIARIVRLPDRERLAESAEFADQMERRQSNLSPMAAMLVPAVARGINEEVEARTRLNIVRAALAVERYRMANGTWPQSLEALVPDLVDAVPQDPFADGTIVYKREGTGVLIYSVGPNGEFDGGRTRVEARAAGDRYAYDLPFRLLDPAERGTREWVPDEDPATGGLTMLHIAAQAGNRELAERVLAGQPDVDRRDAEGRTALHMAAEAGRREIVELLLARGADVNATDLKGRTPTGLAVQAGHDELADFLREHGGIE